MSKSISLTRKTIKVLIVALISCTLFIALGLAGSKLMLDSGGISSVKAWLHDSNYGLMMFRCFIYASLIYLYPYIVTFSVRNIENVDQEKLSKVRSRAYAVVGVVILELVFVQNGLAILMQGLVNCIAWVHTLF